ncbi:MAG: histidinol-phosphatase [Marinifilum sp.]|jgi:histidinol-phosphatase (PHP family)|nr:histidinol-phosphatase [Marinifilum sp.]
MKMAYFSYHTHSSFCDGKENPESYIQEGIKKGMKAIGFSSHAPLNSDIAWAMKASDVDAYVTEINRLKRQYKDEIEVYLSMEIDYIPGVTKSFSQWKKSADLDYTIGSVHLVKSGGHSDFWFLDGPDTNYSEGLETLFQGDIRKAVSAYYNQIIEMIKTQKPDVIGHIDKVKMNNKSQYFSEKEDWYIDLLNKSLDAVAESGTVVEVNTRGVYKKKSEKLFPDDYFLKECCNKKIPIMISSDAHHPNELLNCFDDTIKYLKQIGFEQVTVFHKGVWKKENI